MMNTFTRIAGAAAAAALALGLAACGSGSSSGSGAGAPGTLVVGMPEQPSSLNPVLAVPASDVYFAYDPLIHEAAQGQFEPDLATSWRYVGSGNKTFEVTLRTGVKFSDGSPLTAAAVAASMNYFLKTPGPNLTLAGPVASVTAVGTDTVRIQYKTPYPDAVLSLTQDRVFGLIIGPAGLAAPTSLDSTSDGAGEYTLSASQTTAPSLYTFLPNPHYFNQSAIRFGKVQIRPYTEASTQLAAIRSGQVQYAQRIAATEAAAGQSAGLTVSQGPSVWAGLSVEDQRSGPLKNQQVREALQLAVDREAIVKAVFNGYARSQAQIAVQGFTGSLPAEENKYSYNPASARELLAGAGYPHGFTLSLLDLGGAADPGGTLGEAIVSELAAIGVTAKLTVINGTFTQFTTALFSKRYQVVMLPVKSGDMYFQGTELVPAGTTFNLFGNTDATVSRLMAEAATASTPSAVNAAAQQLNERLDALAWFVPVALHYNIDLTTSSLKNVPLTYKTGVSDPVSPVTDQNWYFGS